MSTGTAQTGSLKPLAADGENAPGPKREPGSIGPQAQRILANFSDAYYFAGIGQAVAGGLWDADNPDGYNVLAVAENRQSIDLVQERLARIPSVPREAFFYDDFQGVPRFRAALANLLQSTFMKGIEVNPANICVASGCGAVLSNFFNMMSNPGEAVLIPAPYYPGFDFDTRACARLEPWPMFLPDTGCCAAALTDAADAAEAAGHPVHTLLLCNPNNPLGTIYSDEQLLSMMTWCCSRGVHLMADEVYAISVFAPDAKFTSMEAVALEYKKNHPESSSRVDALVHVVFGISKDFCASGFRVGVLLTHNQDLIKAMAATGYFSGVSNMVQHALSDVFEDTPWLMSYCAENARRLGSAYSAISGALTRAGIPFVPAVATMMLWMDLRKGLRGDNTWEGERALWKRLADNRHVILTPGECCHAKEPGWFRACYAWGDDPEESLPVTVHRISEELSAA